MALTLEQQHDLAVSSEFVDRVEQAIIDVAIDVSAEDPDTVGHDQRAALAYRVLHDSRANAKKFSHGLVTHAQATMTPPDGGILTFCAALWNAYAGVNPNAASAASASSAAARSVGSKKAGA